MKLVHCAVCGKLFERFTNNQFCSATCRTVGKKIVKHRWALLNKEKVKTSARKTYWRYIEKNREEINKRSRLRQGKIRALAVAVKELGLINMEDFK